MLEDTHTTFTKAAAKVQTSMAVNAMQGPASFTSSSKCAEAHNTIDTMMSDERNDVAIMKGILVGQGLMCESK